MKYRIACAICCLLVIGRISADAAPIDDLNVKSLPASIVAGVELPELEAAALAFKRGKLKDAVELLDAARQHAVSAKVGELPPTNLMLARLYINAGQTAQGKAILEQVAAEHAGHPEVYLLFGNLALFEGRLTDAQLHFERAQSGSIPAGWNPQQQVNLRCESFAGQARVAELRQDWFHAQSALKQWSLDDPTNASVRDRLGAALFLLGREQEAFDEFKTSFRQDPRMNPPEVSMAVMYVRKNDLAVARQAFEACLKKYPTDGRVFYEYSAMLLMDDKAAEAKTYADKAAELGVDTPELSIQRGYIARQLKNFAEAEQHFTHVLDKSPSHFEAMNQLALVLVEQGDKAKQNQALQLAEMNIRRFPESSYALSTLGWVQFKMGDAKRAEQSLRQAANRPKMRTETIYYLLRVLAASGKHDEVNKWVDHARTAFEQPGLFVLRDEALHWLNEERVN